METLSNKAREFWGWFQSVEERISGMLGDDPDRELSRELYYRVSLLHKGLGWEIGPGKQKENQFVVSPNRDQQRLEITRKIVQEAPTLPSWEFFHAKPRKSWNYEIELLEKNRTISISAQNWEYRLIGFSNNSFFDIEFFTDYFDQNIDDMTYQKFGVLIVESEIGEELLIERLDRINVYLKKEDLLQDGLTPVQYLYEHLQSLLSD